MESRVILFLVIFKNIFFVHLLRTETFTAPPPLDKFPRIPLSIITIRWVEVLVALYIIYRWIIFICVTFLPTLDERKICSNSACELWKRKLGGLLEKAPVQAEEEARRKEEKKGKGKVRERWLKILC